MLKESVQEVMQIQRSEGRSERERLQGGRGPTSNKGQSQTPTRSANFPLGRGNEEWEVRVHGTSAVTCGAVCGRVSVRPNPADCAGMFPFQGSQPGTLRRSVGSAQAACGGRESKPRCKDAGDGQGDRGPAAPFPVASGCKPAQPTTETLTRDPCRSPWAGGPLLYPCAVVGPALEPILTGPMGASVPPTRSHTESFEVSFPFSCSEVARTAARFAVEGTHTHTHTLHVRGY
jgi:hypothetical protein